MPVRPIHFCRHVIITPHCGACLQCLPFLFRAARVVPACGAIFPCRQNLLICCLLQCIRWRELRPS